MNILDHVLIWCQELGLVVSTFNTVVKNSLYVFMVYSTCTQQYLCLVKNYAGIIYSYNVKANLWQKS